MNTDRDIYADKNANTDKDTNTGKDTNTEKNSKFDKKKILKIVLLSLAGIIAFVLLILFFYLPRYWIRNVKVEPAEIVGEELTIMSLNARCYAPDDLLKRSWFYRAKLLATDIASVSPDVVCFQEMNGIHNNYFEDVMPEYDYVTAFRDDSLISEACSIFYRADRFEALESGHFWLSKTPDEMSKDWNSAYYRICVYVCLRDVTTGKEFIVLNTHMDNRSEEARINSLALIASKVQELGDRPAFLMGDMNALPASKTITSAKSYFDDAKSIATVSEGNYTYNNWGLPNGKSRLDYIFITKGDATVSEYYVVNNSHKGIYSSDHSPIYIKMTIN